MGPNISKYLSSYAESESRSINFVRKRFSYCLVIPAYQEIWQDVQKVWQQLHKDLLIILVVNAPESNDPATNQLIDDIKHSASVLHRENNLYYLQTADKYHLLLVDRCHPPIPPKQGVGLARKIGADIALSLIHKGCITCPWIFNTDADVQLPQDYLAAVATDLDAAAVIYPFTHLPNPRSEQACHLYEISLFYYVAGLRYAGSPYAFHTIGSTIAINANHYASVRGFPRRNAGEDFYLLNKLAKTGNILELGKPILQISGRLSERVVFGTGPAMRKIIQLKSPDTDFLFYNPRIFLRLKQFLARLKTSRKSNLKDHFTSPETEHWCREVNLHALIASKQNQKPAVFNKFIHDWMDGFRTLKFVHFMRRHYDKSLPISEIFDGTVLPLLSDNAQGNLAQRRELLYRVSKGTQQVIEI